MNREVPFAVGAFYGVRVWRVAFGGVLTGVTYHQSWRSGINNAICRYPPAADMMLFRHQAPQKGCGCGFYGFYNYGLGYEMNAAHFGRLRTILGVVRGTGRVVHGDEGFRAQKAEIVALVRPRHIEDGTELTRIERFNNWVMTLDPSHVVSRLTTAGCLSLALMFVALMPTNQKIHYSSTIAMALATVWFVVEMMLLMMWMLLDINSRSNPEPKSDAEEWVGSTVTTEEWEKVLALYPDVQVFDSLAGALEAFPLSTQDDFPREGRTRDRF